MNMMAFKEILYFSLITDMEVSMKDEHDDL